MEIETKGKRKVLFEMDSTKGKAMFVGFEVVRAEDFFRKMGKNDEEIKEEIRRLDED